MTITEFLLARIAEDEEMARAAFSAGSGRWSTGSGGYDEGRVEVVEPDTYDSTFAYTVCFPEGSPSHEQAQHIARHDPARVLAECEAKRRIIELRYSWDLRAEGAPEAFKSILRTQVVTADTVLRTLAAVYADHPDYDKTWKP